MSEEKRTDKAEQIANTLSTARELYWDALGQEALERVGECPQLKGVIHELAFRDKLNMDPGNLLAGNVSKLTKNPQAHGVDVVTLNKAGRPVARYQVKDCTSPAGIRKTVEQGRNGKYRSSQLVGTNETTDAYNAAQTEGGKSMQSTGISSKRTARAADNAGVQSRENGLLLSNLKDIGSCAADSAVWGAASGVVSSACTHWEGYQRGEMDGVDFAAEMACEAAKGGSKAAATTAAALTLKEAGKEAGKRLGSEALRKAAGSNVGTSVAFGLVELGIDAVDLAKGDMDGQEFAKKATSTATRTAGSLGGAELGAIIGTVIFPGVGTTLGALLGGIAGGLGGDALGDLVGDWFW